jgi:hypothetical protein
MSSTSENSSSKFNALFDEALAEYKKQTGKDLRDHPLASDIDNCDTADSLLVIFQKQAKEFKEFRDGDPKLMKWLQPVVNGLYSLSSSTAVTIVVGLVSPNKVAVVMSVSSTPLLYRRSPLQTPSCPLSASFSQCVSLTHLHLFL